MPTAQKTTIRPSLGTLLRHEWRLNGRTVWSLIAAQAAITGVHLLLAQLPLSWSTGFTSYIIGALHIFGIVAQMAAIAVVAAILLISYYQSMHGQYSAFTAAVPVRAGAHLLVKTLWAYVAFMASVALGVLGLVVGMIELSGRSQFGARDMEWPSSWDVLHSTIEANPVLALLLFSGAALLMLQLVCEGVFIVTVGSSAKFSRHGFAVGVLLAIVTAWLIRNACTVIGILAAPVVVKFTTAEAGQAPDASLAILDFGTFYFHNAFPLGLFAGMMILIAVCWAITYRQLAKHWSL